MQHYLNMIYFGRGAYGIEAAAQTYFGKSANEARPWREAAVLAALIKQPEPSDTHKGFDPAVNPTEAKVAVGLRDRRHDEGGLAGCARQTGARPSTRKALSRRRRAGIGDFGVDSPNGNVINYVRQEMDEMGLCSDNGAEGRAELRATALRDGGYRITTTIDPKLQTAAENAASAVQEGLRAERPAEEPDGGGGRRSTRRTGRVLAYYGGDNGAGFDYAGKNTDKNGDLTGGHSPGSSFKIYTLAAALEAGISRQVALGRHAVQAGGRRVRSATPAPTTSSAASYCTLRESTVQSLNVPFYWVTEEIGADKVVDMARKAGVSTMWRTDQPAARPST